MDIKIKSGLVTYTIKDEYDEEIGSVTFNPGDVRILSRFEEVYNYFSELHLENASSEALQAVNETLKEKMDYLLGTDTSGLFKAVSPLAFVGDNLYIIEVLKAVEEMISKSINNKLEKYDNALSEITGE